MEKITKDEYVMALGIVSCYEKENGTHHTSKKEYDEPEKEKEEEKELEDKG